MKQLELFGSVDRWEVVPRVDARARALADRHYSRQTVGAIDFLPPGVTLALVTRDGCAVWGVVENLDPAGNPRWRCTIFRNEGPELSSELIREATERTFEYWATGGRAVPRLPLTTEVDPAKTRRKRDPGRCFLRAGWTRIGEKRGLVIFRATVPERFRERHCERDEDGCVEVHYEDGGTSRDECLCRCGDCEDVMVAAEIRAPAYGKTYPCGAHAFYAPRAW